jgi:hypothetical protein
MEWNAPHDALVGVKEIVKDTFPKSCRVAWSPRESGDASDRSRLQQGFPA